MFRTMALSLLIGVLSSISRGVSLNPQETIQVLSVAREDPTKAIKYYLHAIEEGEGPAQLDAMYELAHLHSQSPEKDFLLLTR
jgi:TPR repeat protein